MSSRRLGATLLEITLALITATVAIVAAIGLYASWCRRNEAAAARKRVSALQSALENEQQQPVVRTLVRRARRAAPVAKPVAPAPAPSPESPTTDDEPSDMFRNEPNNEPSQDDGGTVQLDPLTLDPIEFPMAGEDDAPPPPPAPAPATDDEGSK
jgi:hypothetical protein